MSQDIDDTAPAVVSARLVLIPSTQTTVALFDAMVSAVGLTEALIAPVLGCRGESAHTRMRRRFHQLRGGAVYSRGPR
jgi:hypothetical protein